MLIDIKPISLAFIITYKCTSACKECCFSCGPHRQETLPVEKFYSHIDYIKKYYPTIKLIVFTGGECFLIDKIFEMIKYAKKLGYLTRCVSNAFWAKDQNAVSIVVKKIKNSGLDEINFSTGDDHIEYIQYERVVDASIATANAGITTLIAVDETNVSHFKYNDAVNHPKIVEYNNKKNGRILFVKNAWIPIQSGIKPNNSENFKYNGFGCDKLLSHPVITPLNEFYACCGLTAKYIPELYIGNLNRNEMVNLYETALNDFLFIWIRLDGPINVLKKLSADHSELKFPNGIKHPCQACYILYNDCTFRKYINEYWKSYVKEILFRYHIKQNILKLKGKKRLKQFN